MINKINDKTDKYSKEYPAYDFAYYLDGTG
jgi:hypothetical protein